MSVANCDCGFSAEACKTNPCMRKKMATSGLNPEAKYPYCGTGGIAQYSQEPIAWLDVRTAELGWKNRIVATNPQYVENNGPENFVALYASPVSSTNRGGGDAGTR